MTASRLAEATPGDSQWNIRLSSSSRKCHLAAGKLPPLPEKAAVPPLPSGPGVTIWRNPMPAQRKYADAQRQALWRLHEDGLTSIEIARAAELGKTGLAPFRIPDRTVRAIIDEMASEARPLPTSVDELDTLESIERAPTRAARLVKRELDRLESKQGKRGLSDQEIDRLPRLATHGARIAKLLQGQGGQQKARGHIAGQGARARSKPESALERLARGEQERVRAGLLPSDARACHVEADSDPIGAAEHAPAADPGEVDDQPEATVPDLAPAIRQALARSSLSRRAEAAQKAREALALP